MMLLQAISEKPDDLTFGMLDYAEKQIRILSLQFFQKQEIGRRLTPVNADFINITEKYLR